MRRWAFLGGVAAIALGIGVAVAFISTRGPSTACAERDFPRYVLKEGGQVENLSAVDAEEAASWASELAGYEVRVCRASFPAWSFEASASPRAHPS